MKYYQGRMLVVDDNQINRNLLVRRLKRYGHLVTVVDNGFQALEIMR